MPVLLVLGLAGFASTFGFRLVDPLIPDIARTYGVAVPTAAALATAYSLTYALAQPVLGPIGDALGKAVLIRVATGALAAMLVATAFAPDFPSLMAARALSGVAAGGIIPLAIAAIGDRVALAGRQVAIARFLFAILAGQIAGSVGAGALAGAIGWQGVFLVAALVAALACLATALFLPQRTGAPRQPLAFGTAMDRYRDVLGNATARPLLVLVALEGALVMGIQPYVAAILQEREAVGAFEAGLVIGGIGIGGLLYTLAVSPLVRLLGPRGLVVAGGLTAGLALIAFGLVPVWQAAIAAFVALGFGFMMLHNTLQTLATELAAEARGSAIALFALAFFVGQGLGPLLFSGLYHTIGAATALDMVGIAVAGLGLVVRRILLRPA